MELVTATNAYAVISLSRKAFSNNFVWFEWKDITLVEMKAYLGVIMNMAMNDKPDVKSFLVGIGHSIVHFFLTFFPGDVSYKYTGCFI